MKQKIGGSYIKCRLKWIAAVIGCGIVMTAVLFLNEVPAGEIAYGMLLCLGILLFAVTMDGISYGRRHRELFALQQSITVSLENLPEPGEILEEDYQQLLGLLAEEKMRIWNTAVSEPPQPSGPLPAPGRPWCAEPAKGPGSPPAPSEP